MKILTHFNTNRFNINIQIFADTPDDGAGSGGDPGIDPGAGAGDIGDPAAGAAAPQPSFEVPEYITNHISGLENAEQKAYLETLLADEKGINLLKDFIPDPNKEWDIKAEDYEDPSLDIESYIKNAKEQGMKESEARLFLENRKRYVEEQRNAMTPELRALDETINNFISQESDVNKQMVYQRLAENAWGREVLKEFMSLKTGKTPSISSGGVTGNTRYTRDTFIEEYNEATPYGKEPNKTKLRELENFAKESNDPFFKDFLGIK